MTGLVERFLRNEAEIDVSILLSPDVDAMSRSYSAPVIYKYFAADRRPFFQKPQLRLSQRAVLNDPFEMSRRWNAVRDENLREILTSAAVRMVGRLKTSPDVQAAWIEQQAADRGLVLSPDKFVEVRQLVALKVAELSEARETVQPHVDFVFSFLERNLQGVIDTALSNVGVVSVTADPLNEVMWAHYASGGAGFAIGLDAHAKPFVSEASGTKRNLLRQVVYEDEWADTFWRNPLRAFLVKGRRWEHEQEWRMLKPLAECDERLLVDGLPDICLSNLHSEAVQEVYFGYGYDPSTMEHDSLAIRRLGGSPKFFHVRANRNTGKLDAVPL